MNLLVPLIGVVSVVHWPLSLVSRGSRKSEESQRTLTKVQSKASLHSDYVGKMVDLACIWTLQGASRSSRMRRRPWRVIQSVAQVRIKDQSRRAERSASTRVIYGQCQAFSMGMLLGITSESPMSMVSVQSSTRRALEWLRVLRPLSICYSTCQSYKWYGCVRLSSSTITVYRSRAHSFVSNWTIIAPMLICCVPSSLIARLIPSSCSISIERLHTSIAFWNLHQTPRSPEEDLSNGAVRTWRPCSIGLSSWVLLWQPVVNAFQSIFRQWRCDAWTGHWTDFRRSWTRYLA